MGLPSYMWLCLAFQADWANVRSARIEVNTLLPFIRSNWLANRTISDRLAAC